MAWKVDGKIAMNFPGSGVPNRDTYQIRFAPTGCSAESQILEIEKVYFVPAGATVTSANLSQYLVWHRYWDAPSYVPYDDTCDIIIHGDNSAQKFTVQVVKNGEDVTSSLDHFQGWAYIVNDVLPSYRMFLHDIPYTSVITSATEITVTDLINGCKAFEHITDGRYDGTKGEFSLAANAVTSKAGGSFPASGTVGCRENVLVPYTLTEDTSTNDVWIVVKHNTSNTPLTIKTIKVATTFTGQGSTSIYVFHESGLLVYKYDSSWYSPSVTTQEHGGMTYNYVTVDLSALSTGTFSLKRGEKYYIKIKHASNNDNHYYYRDGGILGIVGFVTGNINLPGDTYDISSLTYDQEKSTEAEMLSVSTVNHYARYTGPSSCFSSNQVYKCKQAFTYIGITEDDCELLAMANGAMGTYNGQSGAMSLGNKTYVKSGSPVSVTKTSNYATIIASADPNQIFKFTGNTVADIFVKDRFYSCSTTLSVKAEITTPPDISTVSVGDVYLATADIWYDAGSERWQGKGFYKVTSVDTGANKYYVSKQNSPVVDQSDNMKAKLSELTNNNISTYYDYMSSTDLSGLTVSTTHKHEILMES